VVVGQGALEDVVKSSFPDPDFWRGKRVLLSGHTGFKGSWLAIWLRGLGAKVVGLSLPPQTQPSLFELANVGSLVNGIFCDLADAASIRKAVVEHQPEIVLHLAAQALVRRGYREPLSTFATNVMGTAHVLDALRGASARVAVMITTDKVYASHQDSYPYRESDPLGGHDPYSASKAACEHVISSYRDSFLKEQGTAVASARAGNVIGGGDWAEDRLIPDAIRAWERGDTLHIRRPRAVRPWQHVLEPLSAYLVLAERLWAEPALSDAYNFGPLTHEAATVREVIETAQRIYGGPTQVQWDDGTAGPHESTWLSLEIVKAQQLLDIAPRWGLKETIVRTIDWYRELARGSDARKLCEADIETFAGRA
jgi:CDP-glucose 4,6-dehydratase